MSPFPRNKTEMREMSQPLPPKTRHIIVAVVALATIVAAVLFSIL